MVRSAWSATARCRSLAERRQRTFGPAGGSRGESGFCPGCGESIRRRLHSHLMASSSRPVAPRSREHHQLHQRPSRLRQPLRRRQLNVATHKLRKLVRELAKQPPRLVAIPRHRLHTTVHATARAVTKQGRSLIRCVISDVCRRGEGWAARRFQMRCCRPVPRGFGVRRGSSREACGSAWRSRSSGSSTATWSQSCCPSSTC
jgi:hypothetical protein